jgi:hypothetical protein
MSSKILDRVLKKTGIPNLVDILSDLLTPSELHSLMLEVSGQRAQQVTLKKLYNEYMGNRFVLPSEIPQSQYIKFDSIAIDNLPAYFETLDISPVAPLGSCSVISNLSQNRIISTCRNNEVIADSTNYLALECVKRRKINLYTNPKSAGPIRLATSHRLIRGQAFTGEKFSAHFRVFSLCTAGRDEGHLKFESTHLREHIDFYLTLFKKLLDIPGDADIEVFITDFSKKHVDQLWKDVAQPLSKKFANIQVSFDQRREAAKNYYGDICFRINLTSKSGESYDLVDGGFTDWTQKLISNEKERLLTSGLGTELFLKIFDVEL